MRNNTCPQSMPVLRIAHEILYYFELCSPLSRRNTFSTKIMKVQKFIELFKSSFFCCDLPDCLPAHNFFTWRKKMTKIKI